MLRHVCLSIHRRSAVFLSASAGRSPAVLPGFHVHAYPATPTRDDRLDEAKRAAVTRAEQSLGLATRTQRNKKLLATATATAPSNDAKREKVGG